MIATSSSNSSPRHSRSAPKKIRFPDTVGIGVKPVSEEGTERIVRAAIEYAIANNRDSVTLVHKGNIMKFTEGAFRDWGYALARKEYGATDLDGGPWQVIEKDGHKIIVKDVIADAFLQQILLRPAEYEVIATLNLNGDYVSDALAACVGGIGIAPGGNINYDTGHAIFEATHGTAPKYAGLDKVNPGSVILSGEMMLRHLGWLEAADLIVKGHGHGAIASRKCHLRLRPPRGRCHRDQVLRLRAKHRRPHGLSSPDPAAGQGRNTGCGCG